MKTVTLADLTEFHRTKVLTRAREWRLHHHKQILELIKNRDVNQNPHPPTGSKIFRPNDWDAFNWMWFSKLIHSQLFQRSNPM